MRQTALLIILILSMAGCKNETNDDKNLSKTTLTEETGIVGSYSFDLYGENGQITNHGEFTILPNGDTLYTGSWQIENGPSGNVFCTVEDTMTYVHLEISGLLPREYLLVGKQEGGLIKGQWWFIYEVGPAGIKGTFEAVHLDK